MGLHAVRIVGWGVENGVDYWLIANSWSTAFGHHGFFKVRRGRNEVNIEDMINFAYPDSQRSALAFNHLQH